jgi:hypothetical protein
MHAGTSRLCSLVSMVFHKSGISHLRALTGVVSSTTLTLRDSHCWYVLFEIRSRGVEELTFNYDHFHYSIVESVKG